MTNKKQQYNMIKEIFEQPEILNNLLNKHISIKDGNIIFQKLKDKNYILQNVERVLFLGCGSSYYSALYASYIFEEVANLPSEAEFADEFIVRKKKIEKGTMVVVLSQSGETADIITAIKQIKKEGFFVLALINANKSTVEKKADITINIKAGEEKAMPATKSFFAQISIIALLSIYFGRLNGLSMASEKLIIQELRLLPEKVKKIIKSENIIKEIAKKNIFEKNIVVLGRHYCYPIAMEGAHKLKEVTYIHAEGFATEEFRHGPNAIIEKGSLCIFIIPQDDEFEQNIKVIKKIKKNGGKIIAITNKGNKRIKKITENIISSPNAVNFLMPIISVVCLQIFAYHLSILKKINPDISRNIKKYVSN